MKSYQLVIAISDQVDEKEVQKVSQEIEENIKTLEGKIQEIKNLGYKKLAYPIKKNQSATYFSFSFDLEPDKIKKLQSELKSISAIIRIMILNLEMKKSEKSAKTKAEKTAPLAVIAKIKEEKPALTAAKTPAKTEIAEVLETVKTEKDLESAKIKVIKKAKPEKKVEKPEIAQEIESEDERMKKLEQELDKILEE